MREFHLACLLMTPQPTWTAFCEVHLHIKKTLIIKSEIKIKINNFTLYVFLLMLTKIAIWLRYNKHPVVLIRRQVSLHPDLVEETLVSIF